MKTFTYTQDEVTYTLQAAENLAILKALANSIVLETGTSSIEETFKETFKEVTELDAGADTYLVVAVFGITDDLMILRVSPLYTTISLVTKTDKELLYNRTISKLDEVLRGAL